MFRIWIISGTLVVSFSFMTTVSGQEIRVDQKKINKELKKKQKEEEKKYRIAVKRHYSLQTKETRKRMKQMRRESRKAAPVKN